MDSRARILVVDDHPGFRAILAHILLAEGFLIAQAENGLDAIAQLRVRNFDLVITDLMMPKCDGLALSKRIGGLEKPPPVILCSSCVSTADDRYRENFADVFAKPPDYPQMLQAITRLLN